MLILSLVYNVPGTLIVNINILNNSADFFVDWEYQRFVKDYQLDEKFPMTGRWSTRCQTVPRRQSCPTAPSYPAQTCSRPTGRTVTQCLWPGLSIFTGSHVIVFGKQTDILCRGSSRSWKTDTIISEIDFLHLELKQKLVLVPLTDLLDISNKSELRGVVADPRQKDFSLEVCRDPSSYNLFVRKISTARKNGKVIKLRNWQSELLHKIIAILAKNHWLSTSNIFIFSL